MQKKLIITNATVVTPVGNSACKGADMAKLTVIENAAVKVTDGIITYVGPAAGLIIDSDIDYSLIDAEGRVVLPGFVDSHTHLIFGGYRPDEFSWRLNGESYMSIMQRGGGIQSTVNATRSESCDALADKAQWFINRMSEMGVTTDRKSVV